MCGRIDILVARERKRETRGWYLSREHNKRAIRFTCVTILIRIDRLTGVALVSSQIL